MCLQFEVFSSVGKALKKVKSERLILQKLHSSMGPLNVQTSNNVCKFLNCERCVLLIHLTQANIKPEPEESWYNVRRDQDYIAMRGML